MDTVLGPPSLLDLPGFLIGQRGSIWRMIHARRGIFLGAALVATAALAREYDAVSLLDQPMDLAAPFVASILLATGLFVWVVAALGTMRIKVRYPGRAYLVFLTGYWLTAPLAWMYAIPIEEFADEVFAVRFNLTLLSIVSLWRVLLFARIVSIQFRIGYLVSLLILAVPCMAIAFVGLFSAMMNLVGIMGGVRLTQTQQVMANYQNIVAGGIFYAFIPVAIVTLAAVVTCRRSQWCFRSTGKGRVLSRGLWAIPIAATLVFGIAMALFQPALFAAARVDHLLLSGRIDDAIDLMSNTSPSDYPPSWDPPPIGSNRFTPKPSLSSVLDAIESASPDVWVTRKLLSRADDLALRDAGCYHVLQAINSDVPRKIFGTAEELQALNDTIDRLLKIDSIDAQLRERLEALLPSAVNSLQEAKKDLADGSC